MKQHLPIEISLIARTFQCGQDGNEESRYIDLIDIMWPISDETKFYGR